MSTLKARPGPQETRFSPSDLTPSKILIVDDSAISLQALGAVLEAAGQRVIPARSAREALDHLLQEEFAVVLLDVRMPEMDGFELAALIRSNPRFKSLPILFVTGAEPDPRDMERGYRLGAVDFIRKPVNDDALRSKVSTFVELYRTRQELERRVLERTAQLQQANEELSDFFENGAIACHWLGPEGRVLRVNDTELGMLGYAREEVLGHSITEYHADPPVIADILRRLWNKEILHDYPARLRSKSGRTIDVLINSSVLWRNGEFIHTRCFTRDVTRSRHAEKSLQFQAEASRVLSSSLDYETTIQKVADLAVQDLADWCVVDIAVGQEIRRLATAHRDPQKVAWAREFQKRYPLSPQESRGVPQVLRTGQPELYPEITDFLLRAGAKDEEHYRQLRDAGMTSVMLVPLSAHGNTIGVLTLISTNPDRRYQAGDLASAQALAERAAMAVENARLYEERTRQKEYFGLLAESSRLFAESNLDLPQLLNRLTELLVPSLADSCYVRRFSEDRRSIVTLAVRHRDAQIEAQERAVTEAPQPAGEGMTGDLLRTGQPVFMPVVDPEAFRQATASQYRSVVHRSGLGSYLMVAMRAQGSVVGALGLGRKTGRTPFTKEELEVTQKLADRVGLALSTWDAFQQVRRAEADVRNLNASLETRVEERTAQFRDALAELNTFAYTVAHDLRAPLRSMNGFSQILLAEHAEGLGETGADLAQRISKASIRMDHLITDLLAYSRLTREEIPLQSLELGAAVASALEQVSSSLEETKAVVQVQKPLPSVVGHPLTVAQAIANLLSNAMKFVSPGVTPRIQVRAEIRGPQARLWVEDNGIGVPPEHQDRLFRVFERLHSRETYPGTGIGLAIVRRAMERMGGQAGMEASPAGSLFWIELPLPAASVPPKADPGPVFGNGK